LYGNSGFLGKNLDELIEKAKEDKKKGKFLFENLREIKKAVSKVKL